MIKAVFFDIDGTLVSFKTHRVPDSTIEAIRLLRENGIKVLIASGRHLSMMYNVKEIEFDGYVTINGAVTYMDGTIIDRHPLEHETVMRMTDYVDVHPIPVCYVLENSLQMNFLNNDTDVIFQLLDFPIPPMSNLRDIACNNDVYQMIAFFSKEDEPIITRDVIPGSKCQRWHPLFSDVVTDGISKVTGIQAIEKCLNITPEEIAVFGDGGNDIDMLRYAGMSIAMGNATEEVRAAAKYTTTDVDHDGILLGVKKWILNRQKD